VASVGQKRNMRKLYLKKIGWQTMGYIYVVQVRDKLQAVVNTVMNLQVP
jgi:hypothetical protein